jgi:DNA-binding transcriptional LysR family regulator
MSPRPSVQADTRRVTLEHLRAFVCVAEDGGFQRASRELHRSQSAITQSLQKLEEILGSRLIERRQGHVVGLTPAGERLLPSARDILARLGDAVGTLQRPELSGRIALGVPDDVRVGDLHGAISRCLGLNRGLRVEVTSTLSSHVASLLEEGRLDIGILKTTAAPGEAGPAGRGLASNGPAPNGPAGGERTLRVEPLHFVAARRIAAGDLDELPLVAFPEGCAYRAAALRALARAGTAVYLAYVSASYENISNAVSAGLGVAALPVGAIAPDHVVLSAADGFPALPPVRLVLIVRSRGALFDRFADVLEGAVLQGGRSIAVPPAGRETA